MKFYICCPNEDVEPNEIHVFFVDSKEEALDRFAEIEAKSDLLREHVLDGEWSDKFWVDDEGKYLFEFNNYTGMSKPRKDIEELFLGNKEELNRFLNNLFMLNVKKFFKQDEELGDLFLKYSSDEINHLPERIYTYIARYDTSWMTVYCREVIVPDRAAMGDKNEN